MAHPSRTINVSPSPATSGRARNEAFGREAMDGLERVFSKGHQFYNRIFYDVKEGSYYDLSCDIFISLEEARSFGVR